MHLFSYKKMVNSDKNTAKNGKKPMTTNPKKEDPQKKAKKKKNKKSKRPKTPNNTKTLTPKTSSSTAFSYTSKKNKKNISPKMKKVKKPASASARKPVKNAKTVGKNKKTFDIPPNMSNKDQIKFVLSNLNDNKSPFKARMQIMKECARILQDEKCDEDAAKFAIDGFKKPYVTQVMIYFIF